MTISPDALIAAVAAWTLARLTALLLKHRATQAAAARKPPLRPKETTKP